MTTTLLTPPLSGTPAAERPTYAMTALAFRLAMTSILYPSGHTATATVYDSHGVGVTGTVSGVVRLDGTGRLFLVEMDTPSGLRAVRVRVQ